MSRLGAEFEQRFRALINAAEAELVEGNADLLPRLASRLNLQRADVEQLIADAYAALVGTGVELPVATSPIHVLVHVAGSRRGHTETDTERDSIYTVGPASDPHRYTIKQATPVSEDGGQGVVFRATTERFGRTVDISLKQLHGLPPDGAHTLAVRLRPMLSLSHDHLARHYEVFVGRAVGADPEADTEIDLVYVASEWIDGDPVTEVVEDYAPMRRLRWVVEIGGAAAALHRLRTDGSPEGLIHRDIKPDNIVVQHSGEAVLIDHGLVRPVSSERTDTKAFTLKWMAPETVGDPDAASPRSDGWAVGQLAYWMICKHEVPWRATPDDICHAVLQAASAEGTGPAGPLAEHVASMLADDPSDRPDLAEWCDGLERLLDDEPALRRRRTRSRTALAGLLIAGLASAGCLTAFLGNDPPSRRAGGEPSETVTLLQGTNGADTFRDPVRAMGRGQPVARSTEVAIECKIHAPDIPTANPAGYWYRLASPPWNGRYYVVANTFFNGDDVPGRRPYLDDVDGAVADCEDYDWGDLSLSDVVDQVDAACRERADTLADVRGRLVILSDETAGRPERIEAGNGVVEQMIRNTIIDALPRPGDEASRRLVDQFVADYYAAAYWFEVGVDELELGGSTGTADASIEAGMVAITDAVDSIVRLGADNCDAPD